MKRDTKSSGSRRDDPSKAAAGKKAAAEKFKAALAAAQAEPANPTSWDEAEALASQEQKPDEIAALCR